MTPALVTLTLPSRLPGSGADEEVICRSMNGLALRFPTWLAVLGQLPDFCLHAR